MSSGVMDLMDTTLSELFEDAVQVSVNDITCDLNPGEVDPPDEPCKFSFKSRFDAENVLLRHPWLVCRYLLVLMPWPSQLTLEEVKFDHTPIWVRLRSIPPFYWNKSNLQEIAGKVYAVYELPKHIEKNLRGDPLERAS
ncbi:hypothetical protein G4B88_004383 [Cannabis sativa]|uniref:DUF4283 domain-containing protein n=1 Tax=Cannabis sativa TaxID=3483 RepID=A0A7J6I2J1_CANSA|nr:hypothetical protein G4B88_004383 [Cannabis sativa]